jgi:hypothetical protein
MLSGIALGACAAAEHNLLIMFGEGFLTTGSPDYSPELTWQLLLNE